MKTYLDHECWKRLLITGSFFDDEDDRKRLWLDFLKFLKSESDVFLNIKFPIDFNNPEYQIYNGLLSGRGDKAIVKSAPSEFHNCKKTLFQSAFKSADNFFLLNPLEQDQLNKWRTRNGFAIDDDSTLFESWKFYRQLDSLKFPRSYAVRPKDATNNQIKSYKDLSIYNHSVTDIVISDRFLFKNTKMAIFNLKELMSSVISVKPNIALTIIGSMKETEEKNPEILKQQLISNLTLFPDLKLEIILDDNNEFKEHDRHLITNYFHITPGSGFCLFNNDGSFFTTGTIIIIHSLFDICSMGVAEATLSNLSKIKFKTACKTAGIENRLLKYK